MKQSKRVVFALVAGVVFCAGVRSTFAETVWYVDDDAPADFATIQAAINASALTLARRAKHSALSLPLTSSTQRTTAARTVPVTPDAASCSCPANGRPVEDQG